MTELTGPQITEQAPAGWVYLLGCLQTRIRTPDFRTGLALVAAIGAAAEAMDHHPDLDLRFTHVDVRLSSHDVGRVTGRDLRLARTVSALAAEAGAVPEPAPVSRLELALDTPDQAAVLPFWAAVLGTTPAPGAGDEVQDAAGMLPTIWFQESAADEPRQHWHPDVWLDPAQVQPRLAAALAAGGTLVSDAAAPSFWVLADPQGNNVCLCTWQDRAGGDQSSPA